MRPDILVQVRGMTLLKPKQLEAHIYVIIHTCYSLRICACRWKCPAHGNCQWKSTYGSHSVQEWCKHTWTCLRSFLLSWRSTKIKKRSCRAGDYCSYWWDKLWKVHKKAEFFCRLLFFFFIKCNCVCLKVLVINNS